MRILFTFIGGRGHLDPLIPIARAAEAAGHTVAVAGNGNQVAAITAAGFTAFATGEPRPRSRPTEEPPLETPDPARDDQGFRDGFAGKGARRHASALPAVVRGWQPDVIVRDEVDFGSAIAAEALGIPCATVLVLAAGTFLRKELVADPLHKLRTEHGLPEDPELAMLDRDLVLSPFPPSFRSPSAPLPPTAFSFRPGPVIAPDPATTRSQTPTVYFTLGTVYTNTDLLTRVITGLADIDANAVVTVGRNIDPALFGPQPDHVRIEQFIPQDELLQHCDLVVSHGGSGSLMGSLAHGLPSVLLPMGADQPHNARRCVELGTAWLLDPVSATPDEVRATISAMLADPSHRLAAAQIQAEINVLPSVEQTIPLLERLAASGSR
jgi:UDP:flavonoid glycosyltransferase YjiC (YdhE family)